MDYNPEAPRVPVQIQGVEFSVPVVFDEGHVLTAPQASVLNQTLRENIRNNFASNVKEALEKAKAAGEEPNIETLQEQLDAYLGEYDFGVNRGGGRSMLDPVEREAVNQATAAVKAALKRKGIAAKNVSKERMAEYVEQALTNHPQIREKARAVVEARRGAASEVTLDV